MANCNHPRPKLQLPGYTPPRLPWQPPTFLPTGSVQDLARALTEQFRGVYAVLQQLGQRRTVVPLIEDLDARAGQVIVGVGAGQTIRLPLGDAGDLGSVGIVLTDVIDPVTVVNPDGTTQTLGQAGAYDFVSGLIDAYQTNPGGTVIGGGVPTDRLLGRDSAGTGAVESISVTGGLEFSGSQSVRIADLGVTTGKLNDLAVTTGKLAANAATNAKLAQMAESTFKGRALATGTGDPIDLTADQAGALIRFPSGGGGFVTTGTYNDYSIPQGAKVVDIAPSGGDVTFTGFAVVGGNTSAFFLLTKFGSGNRVIIKHQNTGSLAANRVNTPGGTDYVMRNASHGVIIAWVNNRLQVLGSMPISLGFPGAPIYDVMAGPFYAAGDGTTDDTAALNAAIAAANAAPGTIYLGENHRITAALTPITASNVHIQGRGHFNGGTAISVDAASDDDWIVFDEAQYGSVRDVWIRGVGALYTTGAAIRIYGAFRIYLERLLITQLANGIEIDTAGPIEVRDVTISDVYGDYGIRMHGNGVNSAHALQTNRLNVSTSFPASVVGFTRDWAQSTAYVVGNCVSANGHLYQCVTSGTSAGSGTGPSGVPGTTVTNANTATITDGTVEWVWAMAEYTAILLEDYAATFAILNSGALQGGYGIRMIDNSGGANPPSFLRCTNVEFDHVARCAISLEGGGQAEFEQTFVTSMLNGPAIQILDTFDGLWRFNGGVLFASGVELVTIAAPYGVMSNMVISGGGLFGANTYDAIRVDANTTNFQIVDCSISASPGDTNPDTRYGISIASGCDNYIVQGNNIIGHDTGAILNTPGTATTRLVRNNIPDVQVLEVEETGAGPFDNYDSGGARHIMASNAAGVFTGFIAGTIGDLLLVSHQGSGYTEIQHNTGSSNANRVITGRAGKNLRLHDNEVATFRYIDTTAGGTLGSRWVLVAPAFPWALASDAATGDVVAFTGTDWVVVSGGNNADVVLRGNATFGTVSLSAMAAIADDTFLANISGSSAAPSAVALATLAGDGIQGGANAVLNVDVSDFAGTGLEDDGSENLRIAASAAGAGLTGGGGSALAVGAGDGIDVNANDVAVDVTDIIDNVTITEVATNNIQRAALTGDVTASAGSNATTIANDAVTNAKAANMAQATIKGRAVGAGTGDPTDLTGLQAGDIVRLTSGSTGFINGTFNDYAVTDGTHVLDCAASGGNVVFTGFAYGSSNTGAWFWLTKFGNSNTITIAHQSASSSAGNRVSCPGGVDYVMNLGGEGVLIAWDNTRLQIVSTTRIPDGDKGDITVSGGGATFSIDAGAVDTTELADDAVTDAKLRNSSALSVIGRASNSTGNPGDITSSADGTVLRRNAGALEWGTVGLSFMADRAQSTLIGRAAGAGTGIPQELDLDTTVQRLIRVVSRFSSDASYSVTPPSEATWWEAEICGGGGGGGGADSESAGEACAGGGGGAASYARLMGAIASGNITGAVGAGGTAGSAAGGNGGTGGNTTFTYNGSTSTAAGGLGGTGMTDGGGGTATKATAAQGGQGGNGTTVLWDWVQADGEAGTNSFTWGGGTDATVAAGIGGKGGSTPFGGGGVGGVVSNAVATSNGQVGRGPGAGGGGGARLVSSNGVATGASGGAGADGCVIIRFYSGPVPTQGTIT